MSFDMPRDAEEDQDEYEAWCEMRDEVKELVAACWEFRDAVLHGRHQLEEPCLNSDQTNSVLCLFDDTVMAAILKRKDTSVAVTENPFKNHESEFVDYVDRAVRTVDVNRLPESLRLSANALLQTWATERGIDRTTQLNTHE